MTHSAVPALTFASLTEFRSQFPALQNKQYFNYGGQGPLPDRAMTALLEAHRYIQTSGPFTGTTNHWIYTNSQKTRSLLAAELGIPADTLTLTEDVTVGCNIALWGMDWTAGDHLVMTDCEHPGIIAAVQEVQRRFGITVSIAPVLETLNHPDPDDAATTAILEQLTPRTRLVIVSHILWNTGQILPLAKIQQACHQFPTTGKPVRVLVDAAQSVGMIPLDLVAIDTDFYAFTGHKWLCGAAGVGGLYVSASVREELAPTFIGWRGVDVDAVGTPIGWKPSGERYEVATSSYPLFTALRGSLQLHQAWGTAQERYDRLRSLAQQLWAALNTLETVNCLSQTPPQSGLVSFTHNSGQHQALVTWLEEQGFMLRTILQPDCVRACTHYFTTEDEIAALVEAISKFPN